jgi:tetratricopeptide (TPR) repeat protein
MNSSVDPDALYEQVWQLRREGRPQDAYRLASDAMSAARQGAEAKVLARVLCVLGQMERDRGRNAEAVACYLEAADLYRGLGDQRLLAYAVRHACDLQRELGRLAEAEKLADEGLALYRAVEGPPLDLANMLRVCALLKNDLGDAEETRRLSAEAGSLYETAKVSDGAREMRSLSGRPT